MSVLPPNVFPPPIADPAIETGQKAHAIGFDREGDDLLDLIFDAVAQIIKAGLEANGALSMRSLARGRPRDAKRVFRQLVG